MAKKSMKELVAYAKKRAKEHHRYGRKKPMSWSTHFDCHWFTSHVYKDCGYDDVYKRITKKGKPAFYKKPYSKSRLGVYEVIHMRKGLLPTRLKAGDIVIRKLASGVGWHSAIYVGNGKVAETTTNKGSHIGKLTKAYKYAFRIPEPKKKETKTVEHVADYELLEYRNVRKSWGSKSTLVKKIKEGTKVHTTKKHGNWVYVPKLKGWICTKNSKNKSCVKRIK